MVSYYVDLAIGLVLAFLLLSLLVSGLNEGVVRLLGIRSKFLWAYLRDTLDGGEQINRVSGFVRWLDRRLRGVSALGRRLRSALADLLPPLRNATRSRLPATILGVFVKLPFGKDPRPKFSPTPAPVDIAPANSEQAPAHQGERFTDLLHERLQEIDESRQGKTSIADIPPSRFSVAVLEIASERGGVDALLAELKRLDSPLYRPLAGMWAKAGVDLETFRKGVEDWFNGEMERLTVLYRRFVRVAVGVLSLLVTLLFSMDSLEYGKTLLNDSAYRSAIAAFAEQGEAALGPIKDQCAPEQDTYACVTEVLSTPAFVKIFTHSPVSAEIPTTGTPVWKWGGGDWWDRLRSPSHWPGFLLTLVALLFGSSFWWDMLRRVTGLKSKTQVTPS
ncbi:hypothetical protein [Herbidospora mongoliensis]|uniref:hypothetical protein n=1 Tax=Herbidospora mongoliensis TaxID=688067 RepID=UPI00082E0801|nr:hypothetical protein [Herbidospora mongoliensis]